AVLGIVAVAVGLLLASCGSPRRNASSGSPATAPALAVTAAPRADNKPTNAEPDLHVQFATMVRPFLEAQCIECHSGDDPAGHLDLSKFKTVDSVLQDDAHWVLVRSKLAA